KQGSDIPRAKAHEYIAGYALGLDMTARGQEDRSFRKSIDGYTVLGPWMITADELPNPADVPFNLQVNDEKRQDSNTSFLIFDMLGLIVTERDKNRAFLATRTGLEAIALERGDRADLTRLSFQVAPDADLAAYARELGKHGIKSEARNGISPGAARALTFTDV